MPDQPDTSAYLHDCGHARTQVSNVAHYLSVNLDRTITVMDVLALCTAHHIKVYADEWYRSAAGAIELPDVQRLLALAQEDAKCTNS